MAKSNNTVSTVTLGISIAVALLVGFLAGIIYSDRPQQVPGQSALQQMPPLPQQNQLAEAISSLQLAVQQNPDNAETWAQLGHAYFDSNQPAKAIEAYNRSLAIIPDNPPVLTDLGVMYRRSGQPEKAIESFNKALTIQPGFEQALYNRGVVQANDLADIKGAIASWKELLQVNPGAKTPNGVPITEMVENLSRQLGQ